jgi:hypothetical protein
MNMDEIEEVIKYGRHFGTNLMGEAEAEASVKRKKLKKNGPDTAVKILHRGRVQKSFNANAERLASAAASGSKYAQKRLAAGNQGKVVAQNLAASKVKPTANKTWQPRKFKQQEQAAKTASSNVGQAKGLGRKDKVSANREMPKTGRNGMYGSGMPKAAPGGVARMETEASSQMAANRTQKFKSGLAGLGLAAGGVGLGSGGAYAYNRNRSA